MSLYNMMCGINPVAGRLLKAINLNPGSIPRFRDIWINNDFTEITVHTRTGGGNREAYADQNEALQAHPLYLRDADDSFDSTFADFTFSVPKEEKEALMAEIESEIGDDPNMKAKALAIITEEAREKFNKVLEALKEPPVK